MLLKTLGKQPIGALSRLIGKAVVAIVELAECLGMTTLTCNVLSLVSFNQTFNAISVKLFEPKILKWL